MSDLSTSYLGISLRNPLVCSSSPLSADLGKIKEMEDSGASCIVLHSLFEEQIEMESIGLGLQLSQWDDVHSEANSYFPDMAQYNVGPDGYLEHLRKAKESVSIPIVGSLNGISRGGWLKYAELMQDAGADALELNLYDIPVDPNCSSSQLEQEYVSMVREVSERIRIPLAVKLGPFFTAPASIGQQLALAGAKGLVIFNRFYQPDIDIESLEIVPRLHFSHSHELPLRLHWAAILCDRISADIAITGGVHHSNDVIKCMLVGAKVAMMTSALLSHGVDHLLVVLRELQRWLEEHEYESIKQMQGSMSFQAIADPRAYERGNYMKVLKSFEFRPNR